MLGSVKDSEEKSNSLCLFIYFNNRVNMGQKGN
jgi:hypothetical protein